MDNGWVVIIGLFALVSADVISAGTAVAVFCIFAIGTILEAFLR